MAPDPRFTGGQMNPGRPTLAGGAPPPGPRTPQPARPAVNTAPIGRPPNTPAAPRTPAPGAPPKAPAAAPAPAAVGSSAPGVAPGGATWGQKLAQSAGGWAGKIDGGPLATPAAPQLSPEQSARVTAVAQAPAQAAQVAGVQHFEALSQPPAAPTVPAAPVQPAPAAPAAGVQSPADPIGTPSTAASTPLAGSPWASERTWGAIGSLGDSELDAALKGATLGALKDDPFGADKLAAADGQAFDKGMAGLGAQRGSINADLVRRGIFSTGAAADLANDAESSARAGIAEQQRSNMTEFAKLSSEHKQQAIASAQSLAKSLADRGVDLENLRMQRESLAQQIEASRRGGGGGGGDDNMIEIDNGDGTTSQVDLRLVDLMLSMGEGGMY